MQLYCQLEVGFPEALQTEIIFYSPITPPPLTPPSGLLCHGWQFTWPAWPFLGFGILTVNVKAKLYVLITLKQSNH